MPPCFPLLFLWFGFLRVALPSLCTDISPAGKYSGDQTIGCRFPRTCATHTGDGVEVLVEESFHVTKDILPPTCMQNMQTPAAAKSSLTHPLQRGGGRKSRGGQKKDRHCARNNKKPHRHTPYLHTYIHTPCPGRTRMGRTDGTTRPKEGGQMGHTTGQHR